MRFKHKENEHKPAPQKPSPQGAARPARPAGQPVRRKPAPLGEEIPAFRPAEDEEQLYRSVPINKTRRVLLVVLPIIALILIGVLVTLIIHMPKTTQRAKLEPLHETPPKTENMRQPTQQTTLATTTETILLMLNKQGGLGKDKFTPLRLTSAAVPPEKIKDLIRTGAGIAPGQQEAPALKVVAPEPVVNPPAAAGEETQIQPPSQGDPGVDAPSGPTETQLPEATQPAPQPVQQPAEAAGGFTPSGMTAYVYGSIVNVRSDADINSEILLEAHAGDVVTEIETNGSWSRVRMGDGFEGYIFSNLLSYNYVAPEEQPAADPAPAIAASDFQSYYGTLYAKNSGVNIRSGPSLDSPILYTMYYGDSVTATGYTGGWFQIAWYDGEMAYVHGDYLQTEPISDAEINQGVVHQDVGYVAAEVPQNPANLAGGAAVANMALQYVGYPYVWGAAGPNSFDCSGFTSYIYAQMGVPISRTTYTQVNDGIAVPFGYRDYSNLLPGDLCLFAAGTDIFHVGIYIGGGQMVHAANSSVGVVVDDLNLDYWASRLAYVRRIFY